MSEWPRLSADLSKIATIEALLERRPYDQKEWDEIAVLVEELRITGVGSQKPNAVLFHALFILLVTMAELALIEAKKAGG